MTKKNDKNNDYWRKRSLNIAKDQIIDTENFVKELQRQYNIAELQTKKDINYWYYRIAQNNNISMAEARKQLTSSERDEFNWSVWDYIKYAKENELNGKWVKELENASAKAHITRLDAINLQMKNQVAKLLDFQEKGLSKLISDVYTNGFYRTIYEHQKGIGEFSPFSMLDSQKIVELIKAPWSKDGKNFSQRIWGDQGGKLVSTLKNEFTNCVIRGDNPTTIAKMISNKFSVSRSSAERLVRTESAVFSSMATKKGYKSIGCEEFEVCAAFETRTCSDCGDRDGEHYPMSKYLVGSTAPPFHPNCRCTTVPYFSDEFTEDETKWSENGSVDGDLSFDDWRKSFGVNDDDAQNRKVIIDKNEKTKESRMGNTITASKVTSIKNRDVYVSDKAKLKPNHIREINNDISKVLDLLGEKDNPNIPKIIITTSRELDDRIVASFNPAKNLIYVSENIAKADDDAILAIQSDFVCPENKLSTLTHEFIHWQDRDRYIRKGNSINSSEELQKYINGLRKDCKKKLDRLEKKGYAIDNISDYAKRSNADCSYDEVYTEYRTKELLGGY